MTKLEKFKAGLWASQVPDVTPARWSDDDWVRHIDQNGRWFHSREAMIDYYGPDAFPSWPEAERVRAKMRRAGLRGVSS